MNQSYQTNSMGKQKYQKTFSSTNYQWNDMQESPKVPKPSFLSSSISQTAEKEAEFMMIEDGISRHYNYIQKNLHRIPNFPSSEKAKEELKRLLEQLNQIKNTVNLPEHPNIEGRLSEITKQHQTLNDEEQRITELRSINSGDKARDDAEYEDIKNKIREAKDELARLERQISQFHEESTFVRDKLDRAKNNLQSRQLKINQLKEEENRLLKLQKQSRHELKAIQNELNNSASEEAKISEIEARIEQNSREFQRLSKVLIEKKEKVREKTEKVQRILLEAATLENRLDEAVSYAGTVTEQKKQETYLNSDSDFNDIEKSLNVLSMNNSSMNNSSIYNSAVYNSSIKNKKSAVNPQISIQSDEDDDHNFSDQVNTSLYGADNNVNYSYQSSYKSNNLSKNKIDRFSDEIDDYKLNDNFNQKGSEPTGSEDEPIDFDYSQKKNQSPNISQNIDQLINSNNYHSKTQLSNSSHYSKVDHSLDNYDSFNSKNIRTYDHSSSSIRNQLNDQDSQSDNHEDISNDPNDLMIEEEEIGNSYSENNILQNSIKNDHSSSFKQNSFKTTNILSGDSDSDEENNILSKYKSHLDANDDLDDEEEDEILKSISARRSQFNSSFSSKGNDSEIANAFKAINTSLADESPVVHKVENATSRFKNNYT